MSDNFIKRVNQKLEARGLSGRQDLELHDAKSVEQGRAVRVLASYSPVYGPPSVFDVQNWMKQRMGEYAEKVSARPETVSVFPDKNFITFIIESKTQRQPIAFASDMVKAGVDQYLDTDQNLWEVVKAEQGPSYIVRREATPVEKMLEVRRQALRGGASGRKHVTLASVDSIPSAGGGFASMDIGDTVDFYAGGLIHRGKVSSVGSAGVKISTSGDSFTVDPGAVTSVVEKSPAAGKEQDDIMSRYWSLVYPGNPDMVKMIAPTATPKSDPRPLKVEPIEKAMNASVSGTVKVKAEAARPTKRTPNK